MYFSRSHIIQIIFILVALLFAGKLFWLQVMNTNYSLAAEKNIVQRIETYPYRGAIYDRHGHLLVYNVPIYDLMVIPKAVRKLDSDSFCELFQIDSKELIARLSRAKHYSATRPSVFIKDISQFALAKLVDKLIDYAGFYIRTRTIRTYPQPVLANTLGYLSEINACQLAADTTNYYKKGDLIGMSGLEAQYELLLRGSRGIKYKITNARGQLKASYKSGEMDIASIPGQDLTTTIDLALQKYGEKIMQNKKGSIVAIEPNTGEILAIISSPSYDPNLLVAPQLNTEFHALEKRSDSPLFHRPIMAMYPPGSIFKIIQALIALQEGVLQPSTAYACNQKLVKCHPHPVIHNLHQAIQYSCNPYFYHVFKNIINQQVVANTYQDTQLGLERWRSYLVQFGLGAPLGIDLPHEKAGFLPNAIFYNKIYGSGAWKASTIRSLDIGQGEMLLTPLQMANLAVIMANRGFYYTPHIVKNAHFILHEVDIGKQHFELVVQAMYDVINNGPGWRAKLKDIAVAGKTGTAQNPHGEDHSVFMGFAPLNEPQIAISVYVENSGWGARAATAVAGLMIEKYLKGKITRINMENYVLEGNFQH